MAIRRLREDEWRAYRELRLRALADSPNAFGSTFDIEAAKADDYWVKRLATAASTSQLPLVAEVDDVFVGLVWGWLDPALPQEAQVFQMWVAPEARGQTHGAQLLDAVISWARQAGAQSVQLRVTCGDSAARRLYVRAGFEPCGDPEPLRPGSGVLAQPMRLDL